MGDVHVARFVLTSSGAADATSDNNNSTQAATNPVSSYSLGGGRETLSSFPLGDSLLQDGDDSPPLLPSLSSSQAQQQTGTVRKGGDSGETIRRFFVRSTWFLPELKFELCVTDGARA
jgi:hypothetical protein